MRETTYSLISRLWEKLPVLIKAIVLGELVFWTGQIPIQVGLRANIALGAAIPWSILPLSVGLVFCFKYWNGWGVPYPTRTWRRIHLRGGCPNSLPWTRIVPSTFLFLSSIFLFESIYRSLVELPSDLFRPNVDLSDWGIAILFGFSALIAAPLLEEMAHRGFAQSILEKRYGPVPAILLVGVVFGLAHSSHDYMSLKVLPLFLFSSVALGSLAFFTQSIWPAVLLHFEINLLLMAKIISGWENTMDPGVMVSAPLLAGSLAGAFWLLKGYK